MPITHAEIIKQSEPVGTHLPTLLVQDLYYTYPDGFQALHGVSLHIDSGEKVALVGPNGAGKSTLMLHFNGLLAGRGRLEVAGLPLEQEHLPLVRCQVGMVFQNPDDQLFSPTVYEDVAFGPLHMGLPEDEVRQRTATALAQVGMEGSELRMPYHLSLGQKKRVAIATVLAMSPAILVLDEPTAGLDPRGRRQFINLLRELPLTMLVSTHDILLVQELFPRMIVMDEGLIVADGPTESLLQDEAFLESHGLERPVRVKATLVQND